MSKLVKILLGKQLTVNLGRDEQGEAKTVVLQEGLQEVEEEIAKHWFVAAHAQEIPESSAYSSELEKVIEQKDQEIAAMQIQIDEAGKQFLQHDAEMKAKDKEISDLKIQLDKALQTQSSDMKMKEPAKAKDAPKEA
ncbi:STY1053 family phage-associated protein [Acinetobacter nosocomialis]|uniref:STY1053 family phage-associated protein n=1 Tax=Acinetobacter nosocomialis TaxID=106654 RepID=UPI0009E0EDED|nr:hypothetical protein [Acinetobacter nosocomialis]ARG16063.1 hypothetical protein B7L44_05335 [Acinetobacter nosocomialis]MBP1470614.1 hypothetical protein [Acinetobacter nosocomialis]MCE5998371.1 hypothetical protein [Acinetobacter nosocomialis]